MDTCEQSNKKMNHMVTLSKTVNRLKASVEEINTCAFNNSIFGGLYFT